MTRQTMDNLGNALAMKIEPTDQLELIFPKSPTYSLFSYTLGLDADHEISQLFSYSSSKEDWSLHEYCL